MTLRVGDLVLYYDADGVELPGVIIGNPAGSTYVVQATVASGAQTRTRKARETSFVRFGGDASGAGVVITAPVSESASPASPAAFDIVARDHVMVAACEVDSEGGANILTKAYGINAQGTTRHAAGDVTVTLATGLKHTSCIIHVTPSLAGAYSWTVTRAADDTVRVTCLNAAGLAVAAKFFVSVVRPPYMV